MSVRNLGYELNELMRIRFSSGLVIREITDHIERSEFIVCDLTNERPNVYYELGYAHGVGNEAMDILLIAREEKELFFTSI